MEGRGTSDALARLPVDLSGLTNLHRMANTPDPRDFYRVSRAVLVPSLWRESLGRVPMEAMVNGIPVLASDRGALPETLGNSGFLFTVPERYTPQSMEIPTAREVAPGSPCSSGSGTTRNSNHAIAIWPVPRPYGGNPSISPISSSGSSCRWAGIGTITP